MNRPLTILLPALVLAACSSMPPDYDETNPAAFGPMPHAAEGVIDKRGRFREIACTVLESHGHDLPHYESCEQALRQVGEEPNGSGADVPLGRANSNLVAGFVPGIGWECFENWMNYDNEFTDLDERLGYGSFIFSVDGLSGSTHNAAQIRDQVLERAEQLEPASLVLIGYSKGASDILEALVLHPEIVPYVAAMVSVAGAVGGSPLAVDADENDLGLMQHIPESDCSDGDGHAIESLRPDVRRAWLAANPLPAGIAYYSLVTFPLKQDISNILHISFRRLAKIDPRNDSQVLINDQLVPGSTFMGYLNADHWAVAVPIAEEHPFIGSVFVDQNTYPRRAIAEAVLRFIEEDLAAD